MDSNWLYLCTKDSRQYELHSRAFRYVHVEIDFDIDQNAFEKYSLYIHHNANSVQIKNNQIIHS